MNALVLLVLCIRVLVDFAIQIVDFLHQHLLLRDIVRFAQRESVFVHEKDYRRPLGKQSKRRMSIWLAYAIGLDDRAVVLNGRERLGLQAIGRAL